MISLGANVVKSACKLWLGDRQYADDVTSELVDLLGGRVSSRFEQRKIGRFFDDCADIVARRLVTLLDTEFRAVPDNERTAAVLAVGDTFAAAPLTDEALFQADVDARLVERQLRPAAAVILTKALLSGGGQGIYWLVLRESCSYLVEVVTTLPKFSSGALTELLRRETAVLDTLSRVLDRLPERRGVDDFAADYRRAVVNKLDRMELLGVTLADANRRYPLSIAYIDLSVLRRPGQDGRLLIRSETEPGDPLTGPGGLRAESVLGRARRVLVIGQAGSGKTTLLQWLAVRSALSDFGGSLGGWNDTVPFFIPLRRYVNRSLPSPEEFPLTVGRNLAHEMPSGWVHGLLRAGRALILVDGVDEMQLTGFAPLTALTSLEHMSLGLLSEGSRDLSPLTSLPRLKTLSLRGQNTFDVSSLAGIRDLAITVPPRARVTGADRLGPMSRITDSEYIDSAAESQ